MNQLTEFVVTLAASIYVGEAVVRLLIVAQRVFA